MTSEGGCGIVLVTADRAAECETPVWILGGASDSFGPAYTVAPVWDFRPRPDADPAGMVGARAAKRAFAMAGLTPAEVDVAELYDPFSFEIIRQLEAFGFCSPGEGGPFVEDGNIAPGSALPVTTDGGTMSFSHPGIRRAAAAAGHSGGAAAPRHVHHEPGQSERRSPSARTGVRGPCSVTCCCWAESAHEPLASPAGGHPGPTPEPAQRGLLGRMSPTPSALPAVRRVRLPRPRRLHRVRTVPRGRHRSGTPARDGAASTAGRWCGTRPTRGSTCRMPRPWSAWTKESG